MNYWIKIRENFMFHLYGYGTICRCCGLDHKTLHKEDHSLKCIDYAHVQEMRFAAKRCECSICKNWKD